MGATTASGASRADAATRADARGRARRGRRRDGSAIATRILAGVIVLGATLPVLWVLKMSLIPRQELYESPPTIIPRDLTLTHYETIFNDPAFRQGLLNSFVIAGSATLLALVLGALAAYPLARLRFSGRQFVMTGILALSFFPAVAIIAPLFVEFRALRMLNTYIAVILADGVFVLPMTVWILTAFFRGLPRELEQAAKLDGASTLQAFRYVIVPLAAPGVFTAGILTFIFAWSEFLFANTFLFDDTKWPVTVVIPNFATQYTVDYGAQAAGSIIVILPIVLLALLFQRRIVSGLTAGAVTG
jgi:ABC-type glycerol-3-phosphate transport system permease component